jgi:gliding motility-associated-like protein/uncharacterized repeat protein (TIGR01451 family)
MDTLSNFQFNQSHSCEDGIFEKDRSSGGMKFFKVALMMLLFFFSVSISFSQNGIGDPIFLETFGKVGDNSDQEDSFNDGAGAAVFFKRQGLPYINSIDFYSPALWTNIGSEKTDYQKSHELFAKKNGITSLGDGKGYILPLPQIVKDGNWGPAFVDYLENPIGLPASGGKGGYSIVTDTRGYYNEYFVSTPDHTDDQNGYMLLVDAHSSTTTYFSRKIEGLCGGDYFRFSTWLIDLNTSDAGESNGGGGLASSAHPRVRFDIFKVNSDGSKGPLISTRTTTDTEVKPRHSWYELKFDFQLPTDQSGVFLEITNVVPSQYGNDLAIDDISFLPLGPEAILESADAICPGENPLLKARTNNAQYPFLENHFQLQYRPVGSTSSWINIGSSVVNLDINATVSFPNPYLILDSSQSFEFRVLVAGSNETLTNSNCRIASEKIVNVYAHNIELGSTSSDVCEGGSTVITSKITNTLTTIEVNYIYLWERQTASGWEIVTDSDGDETKLTLENVIENSNYRLKVSVEGADDCASKTKEASIQLTVVKNAGEDGTLTICEGTTPTAAQLFASLQGTPDQGGTWSNVGNVYTYTVAATAPCTEVATSTVTVTIQERPDAGTNGTLTICEGTIPTAAQLFASLQGTPDQGGTWSNVGNVYTYTVASTAPCTEVATSTVTVTIQERPDAGTNGTLTICEGTTPTAAQLFASLQGTPDQGGTWSNVGNVYTYTVAATALCTEVAISTVTVTIDSVNLPEVGGDITVCASEDIQVLTAKAETGEGNVLFWYSSEDADSPIEGLPTWNEIGSITYWAESVSELGCKSARVPVKLTINACSLSILKTSTTDPNTFSGVGDELTYDIVVTNTGSVTLTNILVVDPLTGLEEMILELLPGLANSVTFETSYIVVQDDLNAGRVDNTARASTTLGVGEEAIDLQKSDDETIFASQDPKLEILKDGIFVDDNNDGFAQAGETVVYTFTVTNTGNVTLSNITVEDDKVEVKGGPLATLAVGASNNTTFTATYVLTQSDIDKGLVSNIAVARAEKPGGNPEDPSDDITDDSSDPTPVTPGVTDPTCGGECTITLIPQNSGITLVKAVDKTEVAEVGEVVVYTLTVTNTGNVTLTDVTITDPLTGLNKNIGTLLPGEVKVEKTNYTVKSSDLQNGGPLVNLASVKGTLPDGTPIEDEASVSVGISFNEIIANDDDFGTYFVSYGGRLGNILENDILNDIVSPDPDLVDFEFTELDGVIGLLINENGELSLIPGVNEAREYRLKYILRETANPSNSDDAFVIFRLLNDQVDLSVVKTSFEVEIYEGDEFEYEIRLSNTGGTPATNVVLVDDLPNGVSYLNSRVESVSSTLIQVGTPAVTGTRITWNIPFLPADGVVVIRIRVQAGDAGTITNVANVSAQEEDTNELNNQGDDVNQILPFRIPNVITPNQDGDNDTFEVKGLDKFVSNEIVIINRYGDHVFERKDYQNDWDAPGQVAGTYFYILTTVDKGGKNHIYKGWIQVIKNEE